MSHFRISGEQINLLKNLLLDNLTARKTVNLLLMLENLPQVEGPALAPAPENEPEAADG